MNSYFTFISNDLKIIFRDKTLILMFFLPIILILVCRIFVPFIANYVPNLNNYYWMISAGFCILSGSTPAFLTAFLMLDEKDENLISVLKTTPLPYKLLITYRIIFLMSVSFLFAIIFLTFNGLEDYSLFKIITSSTLVSFVPAILLMLIIPFARNKIEGVTLFKGINTILFIPIIAFFVTPEWKNIFGIIPFYWVYDLLVPKDSSSQVLHIFLFGLTINIAYLCLIVFTLSKRLTKQFNE